GRPGGGGIVTSIGISSRTCAGLTPARSASASWDHRVRSKLAGRRAGGEVRRRAGIRAACSGRVDQCRDQVRDVRRSPAGGEIETRAGGEAARGIERIVSGRDVVEGRLRLVLCTDLREGGIR